MGRLRRLIGERRSRRDEGVFVVQGEVLVKEAIGVGLVREVYVREGWAPDAAVVAGPWSVHELDARTFDAVNDTVSPQGCMAVCSRPDEVAWDEESPDLWVLVAHGVQDPGNLGTIIRSAEAAGARALVITPGTVDPWSPKAVRASAGAVMHVPIVDVPDLGTVAARGFSLLGTTSHDSPGVESVWDADLSGRLAVVLGNEARGLSLDDPIDRWLSVPHEGRSESLNVAMAAAVVAMVVAHRRAATGMSRAAPPARG